MKTHGSIRLNSAILLAIVFATAANATAGDPPAAVPGARDVIEQVVRDALAVLRDGAMPVETKREKIQQIAYDHINFEIMGRLSLGLYYRKLNDVQKTQYADAFRQYVTNAYRHTTDHYTDEDVKITGDRKESDGDETVQTQVVGTKDNKPGQLVAKVDYRMRLSGGQWKVIDLTIDNVSLVVNFRSQFQEIMAQGGFDVLLQRLREKNAANDK